MGSPRLHPRMTRRLLHVCILSSLLYGATGFHTDTCNHSQIVDTIPSYKTCWENKATRIQTNPCSVFNVTKTCAQETFTPCYGDDTTLIASYAQLELAKFFDTCPDAPTKQETDSYTSRTFLTLDFTETDNNCNREDVEKVQFGLLTCGTSGSASFKMEIKSRVNRARGNLKNILCDTLYETIGECWRIEFPACFADREVMFIKDEMSISFKTIFDAVGKEFVKPNVIPEIDVVKCLQQGSSASSTHPQTPHIGLICLILVTFILPRTSG